MADTSLYMRVTATPPFPLLRNYSTKPSYIFQLKPQVLVDNKYKQTVVSIDTGFLTCIHVRNPVWIETTVCLYLLYICHPVIHRELQNVVYMKKKSMFKKKGEGPVHKYQ